jgi:hypothetical protein
MKPVKQSYLIAWVIAAAVAGAVVLWRAGLLNVGEEVTLPPNTATHR